MAARAKTSTKLKSNEALAQQLLQLHLAALKGEKVTHEATGKHVTRMEAVTKVWSHALTGETQREEVFKAQVLPNIVTLLERGSPQERWAACGLLHALIQSEKHVQDIVSPKVIAQAAGLLSCSHDRARQPAAQLVAFLAQRVEYSSKVAEAALLPLLSCCMPGAIAAWAGARITALHCVTALRALVENVQGETSVVKQARREALVQHGAVPALVALIAYKPQLPQPTTQVPTSQSSIKSPGRDMKKPTSPGKTATSPRKAGKGKKGSKQGDRPPAGRKDLIAVQATACLRYLALCPQFKQEIQGCGQLPDLVQCLKTCGVEEAAFLCGTLWEVTADVQIAQQVVEADGVACLLHIITKHFSQAKRKGGGKAKAKEGKGSPKKSDHNHVTPPSLPEMAVCNATGALHHLTFLDTAKSQVCQQGGAGLLMACLKLGNPQTFENATGVLWHAGLQVDNTMALAVAAAPKYLAHPVPASWRIPAAVDDTVPGPNMTSASSHTGPSVFITQATT